MESLQLHRGDALIIVDVQNDFLPGGNLAVPQGDAVIPVLNEYIAAFANARLPIYATRDWHPAEHCSFRTQGGPWPPHCIRHTVGAEFAADLNLPPTAVVISKAEHADRDAYSGFEGTSLHNALQHEDVHRLFIGGLATDYCVLNTVLDALQLGYEVRLLKDAIRAVDVQPEDGLRAERQMYAAGARVSTLRDLSFKQHA